MPILGYKELLGKNHSGTDINDNSLFLLMGPGRCGKTTYCKSFFESNLKNGSNGIFLALHSQKNNIKIYLMVYQISLILGLIL